MQKLSICLFYILLFVSCIQAQNTSSNIPCIEKINLLPLYGNVEKCLEQKEADKEFLSSCDSIYSSRSEASKEYTAMGWKYTEQNDMDNATKRFNQAWLLDSLNADAYWGLGIIQGSKGVYDEAEELFERSTSLNPNNDKVWYCLAVNNKERYTDADTEEYKKQRIQYLEKALQINPNLYPAMQMMRKEQNDSNITILSIENKGGNQTTKYSDGTSIVISKPQ